MKDEIGKGSFKQEKKVTFHVSQWPRGIYYLQVKNPRRKGKEVDALRVLLN